MPERPLQHISDERLEERWKACQAIIDDDIFSRDMREHAALIAADLSLERNARLAQRWEPAADDDAPDGQYDDRWHAMKRD